MAAVPPYWMYFTRFWTTHEEHLVVFVSVDNLVCLLFAQRPLGKSWIYTTGPKNGFHVVGYNFANSEPIWMKSGAWFAKCFGLALADFWRDPRSSDDLTSSSSLCSSLLGK